MKLLILGAGDHGRVVLELLLLTCPGAVAGFLDDDPTRQGQRVMGYPVVGTIASLASHQATAVALGVGTNALRQQWGQRAFALGLELPVLIHPHASVSPSSELAAGTQVHAAAVVGVQARVGLFGIINTRASIDHDAQLGEAVHIAPGATLAGRVSVGDRSLVGAGATLLPGRRVGADAIIGAGAVVVRDVASGTTVAGCPARELRRR